MDALSANKQENLGRHLARTEADGRQTYDALAATDSDAADALAAIEDPVTQRQFVNAYQRGEVDSDELTTALRRYEELDADEKALARRGLERSGDRGIDLLEARDCNSPCKDYYEIADDIRESDAVDESDAAKLSDSLSKAIDNGDLDETEAAELADEIELLASEYDIDATEVVIRSDTEYLDEIGRGLKELRTADSGSIDEFFAFDVGDTSAVRATVLRGVGDADATDITPDRAYKFSQDVQDVASDPRVDNVEEVIADDLTGSGSRTINADRSSVKGAMYEIRLANEVIDDPDANINRIIMGKEIKTPDASDLTQDQIDSIIKDIDFEKGTPGESGLSKSRKEEIIEEALSPDSSGQPKDSEFDLFTDSDNYLEAKAGNVDPSDLRDKFIRYKAHQIVDDVDSSGTMRTVARPGEFTDARDGSPNTVGEFIDNSDGIEKTTRDW